MNEMKLNVLICSGCDIGKKLDIEKLKGIAEREFKGEVSISSELCNSPELLRNVHGNVVIAACSPREKQANFSVENDSILERVNLREGIIWSHQSNEEMQSMAEDYLRMGINSVMRKSPATLIDEEISKDILVIGGGITGITAALEAAKANYNVFLVEKEGKLGGKVAEYGRILPVKSPYRDTVDASSFINERIARLKEDSRIKTFLSSSIGSISGQPGMFDVQIKSPSSEAIIRVGSIIVATGWKPYDASKIKKYKYGLNPDIITTLELEKLLKDGNSFANQKTFAFVLCAGQRDDQNLPYCSSVCCAASLKEALQIRERVRDSKVFIFYKDMRALGVYEEFYKKAQEDSGIFLAKADVDEISWNDGEPGMELKLNGGFLDFGTDIRVDKVVLATGMISSEFGMYNVKEEHPENGPLSYSHLNPYKLSDGATATSGEHILNLRYRQGPELPTLMDGFPDSHYVCFPYESRRTGIFAAGTARSPSNVATCEIDAKGAALKAIQTVELADRGLIIGPPKVGEEDHLTISLQRCTQCRRCTEECPFGAIDEDAKTFPLYNPLRCRDCGICMGACPVQAISFKQYSVDILHSMIKSIKIPEEDDKLRIVVFACENDAYPALDIASRERMKYSEEVRIIPVRCLGSVNSVLVADSLSEGIDGLLFLGCKYGSDYQCHFVRGSELASQRLKALKETLDNLALEPERLRIEQIELSDWSKVGNIIDGFVESVRKFGPNPFRGL